MTRLPRPGPCSPDLWAAYHARCNPWPMRAAIAAVLVGVALAMIGA